MNEYRNKTVKQLMALARGQMIGRYGIAVFASVLVTTIEMVLTMLAGSSASESTGAYLLRVVITIIIDLLMGILVFGQSYFYLGLVRSRNTLSISDIFYGFTHSMDKSVLVEALYTGASLLTIIPAVLINVGIIPVAESAYTGLSIILELISVVITLGLKLFFGLSFYILCDHPEFEVMEIFRESARLMTNKKGRLILIYLSMIPMLVLGFLSCFIGLFWVSAFYETVLANFYLDTINEEPPLAYDRPSDGPKSDTTDYSI